MKEDDITMPDFEEWAKQLLNARVAPVPASPSYITWLANELYDIFTKGYILGRRIGDRNERAK